MFKQYWIIDMLLRRGSMVLNLHYHSMSTYSHVCLFSLGYTSGVKVFLRCT